jgi:hypothetical protein
MPSSISTVLVLQQRQIAGVGVPGGAAGILQQHQRDQPEGLWLVGHEAGDELAEPDRLLAQPATLWCVGRGRVVLGEDQIDHRKHAGQAIGQQMVGGDLQSGPGVTDLSLGVHQPLRHGGLADQERAGDLAGGQALDGTIRAAQPLTG